MAEHPPSIYWERRGASEPLLAASTGRERRLNSLLVQLGPNYIFVFLCSLIWGHRSFRGLKIVEPSGPIVESVPSNLDKESKHQGLILLNGRQ